MKKTIATLALIFALQGVYAQSIDDMFNRYKEKEGAESVSIPSFLIKLGHLFMDKDDKDSKVLHTKGCKYPSMNKDRTKDPKCSMCYTKDYTNSNPNPNECLRWESRILLPPLLLG